jgi:hypothetical protein
MPRQANSKASLPASPGKGKKRSLPPSLAANEESDEETSPRPSHRRRRKGRASESSTSSTSEATKAEQEALDKAIQESLSCNMDNFEAMAGIMAGAQTTTAAPHLEAKATTMTVQMGAQTRPAPATPGYIAVNLSPSSDEDADYQVD